MSGLFLCMPHSLDTALLSTSLNIPFSLFAHLIYLGQHSLSCIRKYLGQQICWCCCCEGKCRSSCFKYLSSKHFDLIWFEGNCFCRGKWMGTCLQINFMFTDDSPGEAWAGTPTNMLLILHETFSWEVFHQVQSWLVWLSSVSSVSESFDKMRRQLDDRGMIHHDLDLNLTLCAGLGQGWGWCWWWCWWRGGWGCWWGGSWRPRSWRTGDWRKGDQWTATVSCFCHNCSTWSEAAQPLKEEQGKLENARGLTHCCARSPAPCSERWLTLGRWTWNYFRRQNNGANEGDRSNEKKCFMPSLAWTAGLTQVSWEGEAGLVELYQCQPTGG